MGLVYKGPYAAEVHAHVYHEGYAARITPAGTLSSRDDADHIGLVGACSCGWRADRTYPPGGRGSPEERGAERDFITEHLDPLIATIQARSWPRWARRTTRQINQVAAYVAQGRPWDARDLLQDLRMDLVGRLILAEQLVEAAAMTEPAAEAARDAPAPRARPFPSTMAAASPALPSLPGQAGAERTRRGRR